MKTVYKILAIPLLLLGLEKAIRTQTDGFRITKTHHDYAPNPEWNIASQTMYPEVLNQSYRYLGSGVQCYAFLSEDDTTVLKVFKHYHLGPSSTLLAKIPVPQLLNQWKKRILSKRKNRVGNIFSSALIAYNQLPDRTGTFYINLNPTTEKHPKVTIYDKIGIRHELDLNKAPFLLQKKADLIFAYLNEHPKETSGIIDSLFGCITNRLRLGITNTDPIIHKNFGVIDGQVVEIDIGSFERVPYVNNILHCNRELYYETLEVEKWLKVHNPENLEYFEQKRLEAIQT